MAWTYDPDFGQQATPSDRETVQPCPNKINSVFAGQLLCMYYFFSTFGHLDIRREVAM